MNYYSVNPESLFESSLLLNFHTVITITITSVMPYENITKNNDLSSEVLSRFVKVYSEVLYYHEFDLVSSKAATGSVRTLIAFKHYASA